MAAARAAQAAQNPPVASQETQAAATPSGETAAPAAEGQGALTVAPPAEPVELAVPEEFVAYVDPTGLGV